MNLSIFGWNGDPVQPRGSPAGRRPQRSCTTIVRRHGPLATTEGPAGFPSPVVARLPEGCRRRGPPAGSSQAKHGHGRCQSDGDHQQRRLQPIPARWTQSLPHQPLAQIPGDEQSSHTAKCLVGASAWPSGYHGGHGGVSEEIRHRRRQRGAPQKGVTGDLVGLPVHPEHVIGMPAPQRDVHANHPGCELSGRHGYQKLTMIPGLHQRPPMSTAGSGLDRTTLPSPAFSERRNTTKPRCAPSDCLRARDNPGHRTTWANARKRLLTCAVG
jgi:hypothetical protein